MRLFHVSEEANIEVFYPRTPERNDLDKNIGLVWAVDEQRLPNFLTPRDCPRVTYYIGKNTTEDDKKAFFTSPSIKHTVIIEHSWVNRMKNTTLYLYEFDISSFELDFTNTPVENNKIVKEDEIDFSNVVYTTPGIYRYGIKQQSISLFC